MKSRAAVQVADRRYEIDEFPLPKIGPSEGLLRVEASGMCGSDVEQFDGRFAPLGVTYPLIPGHEPFGIIEQVGAEAAQRWGVKEGDRVVVEPSFGCGSCRSCLTGGYALRCTSRIDGAAWKAYGYIPAALTPSLWGGYAEYMYLSPYTVLHKISPDIPLELVSLYQPMGAGLRWFVHEPQLQIGHTLMIMGCGQRALAGLVAAREAGAGKIMMTGLTADAHKLELAKRLGADVTIFADSENVVEAARDATDGAGADVVVDVTPAAGRPVSDALDIAKEGGTVVIGGVKGSDSPSTLLTDKIVTKQLKIHGVLGQDLRAYGPGLKIIESRKYPLEQIHSHTFELEDITRAIETLAGRVPGEKAVHVMMVPKLAAPANAGADPVAGSGADVQ